jgi:ABC-type dipeptide/oligopeptide/nickel transport system ATPase component
LIADEIIDIQRDQRAIFVGRTGSGKSTLAASLLTQFPYVVVIDEKGRFQLPWSRTAKTPAELFRQEIKPFEPQIYKPDLPHWQLEEYDKVFRWVFERQNTTLYVDEIGAAVNGPNSPPYYGGCITRGRELNIRVISGTQRPSRIPINLLSEADHYVMYSLQWEDDRKRMAQLMGEEVLIPLTDPHAFYYYEVGGGPARQYILDLEDDSDG